MASTGSGSRAGQVRTGRPARWRSPAAALAAGAVIVWILVPPPVLAGRPWPAGSLPGWQHRANDRECSAKEAGSATWALSARGVNRRMAYWIQPIEYSRDFGHDRSYRAGSWSSAGQNGRVAVHAYRRRVRFHPAPQPVELDPGQHPGGADPAGVIAGLTRRFPADGLAGGDHRGHRHHRDGDHHLACPGRADVRSLVTGGGDRDLVDRLDRLLGGG